MLGTFCRTCKKLVRYCSCTQLTPVLEIPSTFEYPTGHPTYYDYTPSFGGGSSGGAGASSSWDSGCSDSDGGCDGGDGGGD